MLWEPLKVCQEHLVHYIGNSEWSWQQRTQLSTCHFSFILCKDCKSRTEIKFWTSPKWHSTHQDGVFVKNERRSDCSAPLELAPRTSIGVMIFWSVFCHCVPNCQIILKRALPRTGDKRIFAKNLHTSPYKIYRMTPLSAGFISMGDSTFKPLLLRVTLLPI
jgi:hypothetical protein